MSEHPLVVLLDVLVAFWVVMAIWWTYLLYWKKR